MDDRAALLAAILEHPEEDTPRLVYADCLEEHGERDRAEFIRVQVALAKKPVGTHRHAKECPKYGLYRTKLARRWPSSCVTCPKCLPKYLYHRETVLLDSVGYHVVNTPRAWPVSMTLGTADTGDGTGRFTIRRGFVERWQMTAQDWLTHADALLAAHPVMRVTLTTWPEDPDPRNHRNGPAWLEWLARRWPRITFALPT